ncbi:MAG: carbamoyltransferase HypF [Acidobacteriota bacterium]|nr:carbamoyltransferase HypF [Acidobacteriota bacterium]
MVRLKPDFTVMTQRTAIEVTGLVQGVGFRPFVYALASELELRGFVQNRGGHVFVDVEGDPGALRAFVDRLTLSPPPMAAIDRVQCAPLAPANHGPFVIAGSETTPASDSRVPLDVATCDDCLAELFDPANRRHRHPFITCTQCGPRFSIIRQLPYDRAGTTMGAFPMCGRCLAEYTDPRNRRFHAQAIACPDCGPSLRATGKGHRVVNGDALALAVQTLRGGGIVAVKGIGGFHLACDATSETAVSELRRRKGREARPLAVMMPEAAGRRLAAAAGAAALGAVTSPARPIVLVARSGFAAVDAPRLAGNVAAGSPTVGMFLPYTPLHHLLLHGANRPLVMTSANRTDEPMVCDDAAAAHLGELADLFLTHDRGIATRCDDSVVSAHGRQVSVVRRARGQAPLRLRLAEAARLNVLAVGGHQKNTFCLASGTAAYLSPHVGTLDSAASCQALSEAVGQMGALLNIEPEVIAHDLHPDYGSTRFALAWPAARRIAVQHHHAHVLSCVAEHGCTEPVIGVAFDGAGLGADGAMWGGEFLIVEGTTCRRAAHLAYVPLPGGDVAAREPWRMAVAHLTAACGASLGDLGEAIAHRVTPSKLEFVRQMAARGVCSPATSSMGRLFDAVAALIGLRDVAGFEGQAAMELEAIASTPTAIQYRFAISTASEIWTIDAAPVIRHMAADVVARRPRAEIAAAFHAAVADMIAGVAARIATLTGLRRVVLTGGVFQNALLSQLAARALGARDLEVFEHRLAPCNDGGLALGQALFALRAVNANLVHGDHIACA